MGYLDDLKRQAAEITMQLSQWWLGEPQRFVAAGRVVRVLDPR